MLHQLRTHPEFVEDCFGCKAATVHLANGQIRAWAHANDKELDSYADARKQGIQPRSTKTKDINAAVKLSDKAGYAVKAR